MILETLLSNTIEVGVGLLAEAGFGDEIRDLKNRLTNATEGKRRASFEDAFARARSMIDDPVLTPLLEHRPFQEEVVRALLDPEQGFNVRAVLADWESRLPKHAPTLQKFFRALEGALLADDTWGPILQRFQEQRLRDEAQQALAANGLDLSPAAVVQRVSAVLTGSGAIAQEGGIAVGAGGFANTGTIGQIVLQQIIIQSSAATHSADLRQRYLSRLRQQCCDIPLETLGADAGPQRQVTLDQVYIDMHTTQPIPSSILKRVQQGMYQHWAEVEREPRESSLRAGREIRQMEQRMREREREERLLPALDALRLAPHLVILGDPGGGKSTFVRFVIARLIDGTPLPGVASDLLPVLVVFRDVVQPLSKVDLDAFPPIKRDDVLADAVRDQMLDDLKRFDAEGFAEELRQALNTQRCLLIFDGLDEVPQEQRGLVRRAVVAMLQRYRPPRTIVTCRTRSYQGDARLQGFHDFTLAPFNRDETAAFARAWYHAQQQLGRMDVVEAEQKGDDLAEASLAPALSELSENPLLLTTMAIIHQQEKQLPEQRVCLYDRAVMLLLHRWDHQRIQNPALTELLRDERRLRRIMERLAYEAHRTRAGGRSEEATDLPRYRARELIEEELGDANKALDFLMYVDQRAGLLIGRPNALRRPDTYTFPHRTFQEYLAGCYLLTGGESMRAQRFRSHAAEGDRWGLIAQLGAEELLFNSPARDADREFFYLARDMLEDELTAEPAQRAALWSGQMALLAEEERIERGSGARHRGQAYLRRLVPRMVTLLDSKLTAPERCQAGDVLGHFGDPRFRADAWYLPDEPLLGFVEIPAGPFLMGSDKSRDPDANDDELPQHEIALSRYYLALYPVTVAQFRAFVEASGYNPEDDRVLLGLSNHPVVAVSWDEALEYCTWLGQQLRAWPGTPEPLARLLRQEGWKVTLPSEAEWEKAARGPEGRIYPWGDAPDPERANYGDTNIDATSAVGCFPRGRSPYGLLDLSGNVWEWTRTLWGLSLYNPSFKYSYRVDDGRESLLAPAMISRVLRGATFDSGFRVVRCCCRFRLHPHDRGRHVGFRVAICPCR